MIYKSLLIGLICLIGLLAMIPIAHAQKEVVVLIPDANLEAAVRKELNRSVEDTLTTRTMQLLTRLKAHNSGITDLTGLEHAHNLRSLSLASNAISDVSPLSKLTQLTYLVLDYNNIVDVSPLSKLTQLTQLSLASNAISDVSPLSKLTQLTYLWLDHNNIIDVSPLSKLTQLTHLWLQHNNIVDVSPLSKLTQLTRLSLESNAISDVSPLSKLTQLTHLWLDHNNIVDVSPLSKLTQLTYLVLDYNNIVDVSPLSKLTQLTELSLESNAISDVSPLSTLTQLPKLWLDGNNIVDVSPLTDLTQLTLLSLYVNPLDAASTHIHIPAMQAKEVEVYFDNRISEDVNEDGVVDVQDLVYIARRYRQTGNTSADVNGDNVVNIADLIAVAAVIDANAAGAPSLSPDAVEQVSVSDVRQWLSEARHLRHTDATTHRGILFLEHLLAALIPKETTLLANYPNPFNPETWIPYQLAKDAEVTLTIYAVNGHVVRRLSLGHQPAGVYQERSRAAYWDGKNAFGEPVASGLYFYTLTAGNFSATRKMLIRK